MNARVTEATNHLYVVRVASRIANPNVDSSSWREMAEATLQDGVPKVRTDVVDRFDEANCSILTTGGEILDTAHVPFCLWISSGSSVAYSTL